MHARLRPSGPSECHFSLQRVRQARQYDDPARQLNALQQKWHSNGPEGYEVSLARLYEGRSFEAPLHEIWANWNEKDELAKMSNYPPERNFLRLRTLIILCNAMHHILHSSSCFFLPDIQYKTTPHQEKRRFKVCHKNVTKWSQICH